MTGLKSSLYLTRLTDAECARATRSGQSAGAPLSRLLSQMTRDETALDGITTGLRPGVRARSGTR